MTPEQVEKFWRFPMGEINPETGERDPAFMFLEQAKYAAKTAEEKIDAQAEMLSKIADAVGAMAERIGKIETGGVSEQRIGEIAVDAVNKDLAD